MAKDASGKSTAESLRATRTYGKFRCHNPTCMERLEPKKGQKTIKCPTCGMGFDEPQEAENCCSREKRGNVSINEFGRSSKYENVQPQGLKYQTALERAKVPGWFYGR